MKKTRNGELSQQRLLHTEKMASLGEMAGGMAHEINTPLGAIILSASQLSELIPKNIENADLISEIIQDILHSGEKISRIVRGLKNFSRDSKDSSDFVYCDLVSILKDSVALCEILIKNRDIQLMIEEAPESVRVKCNSSQISQVIVNLVSNARDAVENVKQKWISISLKDVDDFVEIHVSDSGTGIPMELRDKLFQPFFTTKKVGSGTGLGLSIIHGIAETHNGSVYLDQDKKNTTFVFKFPKALAP